MDVSNLSRTARNQRMNIRNFLMVATLPELKREQELFNQREDSFVVLCVQELIDELEADSALLSLDDQNL